MRLLIWRCPVQIGLMFIAAVILTGCATGRSAFKDGEEAFARGSYDQAVASYLTAVEQNPDSQEYRMNLSNARARSSQAHKTWGDLFFKNGNYQKAQEEYKLAMELDGSNFAATDALKLASKYFQAKSLTQEASELLKIRRRLQAKTAVNRALELVDDFPPALEVRRQLESVTSTVVDGVELEVSSDQPITLSFTDAKLPKVFEVLTSLSGINFILDEDVRSNNTTLHLEKATFAQALELLLGMNKLDKKVLNGKTIILFPKSRDKQKQFEDQLIHTFYLSNIDAKKAVNLLRTMLQVRKIYVHEELNAIVIRDKVSVIKLASKILEANDRSNSEVVFDLELIEVNHTDGLKIGPKLTAYEVRAGFKGDPLTQDTTSTITSNIGSIVTSTLNGLEPIYGIPAASFDLLKETGQGEVLANPQIRVKNKEKAKVHIGSREPVITVTINGDQTSENVQYVDVGVKLDVEPTIQLDNTVVTKLGLEVSNVSGRTETDNGTAVLTISTTNANTSLTLKDGQRTVIGGLLRDTKTKSKTTIPILGDIPLLGSLFTSYNNNKSKSEILLSITPRIVKSVSIPDRDVASIWSGGEDDLKFGRNFESFASEYEAGQKGLESLKEDYWPAKPVEEESAATDPASVNQKIEDVVAEEAASVESTPAETVTEVLQQDVEAVEGVESAPAVEPAVQVPSAATQQPAPAEATPPAEVEVEIPVVLIAPEQPENVVGPKIYARGPELVEVDSPFTLTFYVDEVVGLFSAPLYVQYDEDLFEFVKAEEGGFLKQDKNSTIFTHTVLKGSGRIIIGLKQGAGGNGVDGGGELFTMSFKAKTTGRGIIEPTRTNFRDPKGTRLKVEPLGLLIEAR